MSGQSVAHAGGADETRPARHRGFDRCSGGALQCGHRTCHVIEIEIENVAVLTGHRLRRAVRFRCRPGYRTAVLRATMTAGIDGTRLCGGDLSGYGLWPAGPVSAGAPHKVDMNVVVMRGIVTWCQHGGEIFTRGRLHVVQESLLFRCAVPSFLHRDATAIGERKSGDVDCIAKSMLGN